MQFEGNPFKEEEYKITSNKVLSRVPPVKVQSVQMKNSSSEAGSSFVMSKPATARIGKDVGFLVDHQMK